jgi:hypothetical protein
MDHAYRITYRSWHRTHRRMERHMGYATGRTRWRALRAWWRIQRQYQPLVEVVKMTPDHRHCGQVQYPMSWGYTCALASQDASR